MYEYRSHFWGDQLGTLGLFKQDKNYLNIFSVDLMVRRNRESRWSRCKRVRNSQSEITVVTKDRTRYR